MSGTSFKARVLQFWRWYAEEAPRFAQAITKGNCPTLADEVHERMEELLPGFAWVFGSNEKANEHSFTLTGEGNLHKQLLASYWLRQAPSIPGWKFHAARQPGSLRGEQLDFGGYPFDPSLFRLAPTVEQHKQKIDLQVWHPVIQDLAEPDRWLVLFLYLDDVLGEYGTQQWIGEVQFLSEAPVDGLALNELYPFVCRLQNEKGWQKLPPGESTTVYGYAEPHKRFLRGDIVAGVTRNPLLIESYLRDEGRMEDPLQGLGAEYVYVAFTSRILPPGAETQAREEIEESIDRALRKAESGQLIGGALGTQNAYIDLLLFDGDASVEIVRREMNEELLPKGSAIHAFAKNKLSFPVVI